MNLFNSLITEIKTEYKTNPNNFGWRFIVTSKETLEKNNGIALITLNPGGSVERKDHSTGSCENGCAYLSEIWAGGSVPGESTLQKQFQLLYREIAYQIKADDYINVMESSLCGYFIPFRSPDIKSLKEKKHCIEFSKNIWTKILSARQYKVIICIDRVTYKNIDKILGEMSYIRIKESDFDTGWGSYKATVSKYKTENGIVTLARFPHLSRFSIFRKDAGKKSIYKLMTAIFKDY
ncbi:MAG: hypothetical protein CVV49_12745 [Spirochaetae bacterium HGW-Spirochaetae-5]|nr:MAG: hypothetical protein CVV49_12745 [Spirochaetae bacterium HGW-Spirochaetae-5]